MIKTKIVKIITTIMLLTLLTTSAIALTNTNMYAQADDVSPDIVSGSGQFAAAHWDAIPVINEASTTTIAIDAFFVEQIKTSTGDVLQNAICIEVDHGRQGEMISGPISLNDIKDAEISVTKDAIEITDY
jgi:hypothetical protein